MSQPVIKTQTRAGAFDTIAQVDRAIRRLQANGFSMEQLAVICPAKLKDHFRPKVPRADVPLAGPGDAIAMGGALGATLGSLALAATVMAGGVAGVMAAIVLIGGGTIAGSFSNLIVSNGYEQDGEQDYYRQAIERGQIVVGVEVHSEDGAFQLTEAQQILDEAGAKPLSPV